MWKLISAVAPVLLSAAVDKGSDYFKQSGFSSTGFGKTLSSVGSFLSDDLGIDLSKAGKNLVEAYTGSEKGLRFEDMPAAGAISATSMSPQQMGAAGRAPQIPLGSSNRIPNMLQQSNVRKALMRVQTVPLPRATVTGSNATISLASAKVKSRYRKTK
tara:strand:- start:3502 stop:3975 length:474 start_codon:yes stop_codon:yes gene_type:complete